MDRTHKYEPPNYDGQLSEESSQHRLERELKLERLYADLEKSRGIDRLKLQAEIDLAEQALSYQGANPKKLPFSELKEFVQHPHSDDRIENDYRARIRNRATAIRAFCVGCMGGDTAAVRRCASITCPLYPFRLGKDPLRGWDIPKVLTMDDEDDDDIGEFDEGNEGDDKDAN